MNNALNELQRDALGELFNIGLGQAANILSQQVQQEVLLSIPSIHFYTLQETAKVLEHLTGETACAVIQKFSGHIWGDALLALSQKNSLDLIKALEKTVLTEQILVQKEAEILTRVSCLLLSTTLQSLEALFSDPIKMDDQQFKKGSIFTLLNESSSAFHDSSGAAMVLCMSLTLAEKQQSCYVSVIMNQNSLQILQADLDHLLNLV